MLNTLRSITSSALLRLGKPTSGVEYSYLENIAIEYLTGKAPLDGNVQLKCTYYELGNTARVYPLPTDCMRVSKVALKSGTRVWTLTMDNNLRIPENVFDCDPQTQNGASTEFANFYPNTPWGWWNNPQYGYGGGQNENYYRIVNNNIIFNHGIENGHLCVEYFSNGSDLNGDSLFNRAYIEPLRNYLMYTYCLHKGNREEKAQAQHHLLMYEVEQWNANAFVNASRMYELIDAMAQSSEINYG